MKEVLTLTLTLLNISTFALSASDSWDTIRTEIKTNHKFQITSGHSVYVGRNVSVFDVCVKGDKFVTLSQYPIYKRKWDNLSRERNNFEETIIRYKTLTYPISKEVTRQVCYGKEDRNCKTLTQLETQPTVKRMTISKVNSYGGSDRDDRIKELFAKPFKIPTC